jgi:hypothetical protein
MVYLALDGGACDAKARSRADFVTGQRAGDGATPTREATVAVSLLSAIVVRGLVEISLGAQKECGSMSGDGKRSVAAWPKLPRPSPRHRLAPL